MTLNLYSHERLDKGIPRGPKRKSVPRRRNVETNALQAIPEGLEPSVVLDRYLTEQTTSQIAQEYGISRKSMVAWLREKEPERWRQVQILRAHCRKEDADEGIESACDPLSLARAREMLKSGQWDLERLDSQNYGVKQEVTHKVEVVDLATALALKASEIVTKLLVDKSVDNSLTEGESHVIPDS